MQGPLGVLVSLTFGGLHVFLGFLVSADSLHVGLCLLLDHRGVPNLGLIAKLHAVALTAEPLKPKPWTASPELPTLKPSSLEVLAGTNSLLVPPETLRLSYTHFAARMQPEHEPALHPVSCLGVRGLGFRVECKSWRLAYVSTC